MRKINKIIIHCSATPEGRELDFGEIKKWHVEGNGWSDVGYHYIIHLDGVVEHGRPLENAGAHCKGHNSDSIGICYIGGCDANMQPKDTRTEAQKKTLRKLVTDAKNAFPAITIHGHNEFSNKACPCFDVKKEF